MPLADVPAHARRAEALGYDGLLVPEALSDGILFALLALEHTTRLRVSTGVVVAFARSPMLLAQDAWGLAGLSGGRFELGVGSQVKGNIERRFGMPWSAPAARMRDYLGALRAIFACWQDGAKLHFESESYRLTRMQPFFQPEPLDGGAVPLALGAVGPHMTRVAGALADTLITHPTNASPDYLKRIVRPELARGAQDAGRAPDAMRVIASPMTATGADAAAVKAERENARAVLAFTWSTPAYRGTLDHHGRGDVHEELLRRSRAGEWNGLEAVVDDEVLDLVVPAATFDEIGTLLRERYAGLAEAITLRMPNDPGDDARFAGVIGQLRSA